MLAFDISPIAFSIPFFNLTVTWYGICFACGLILSSFAATHHLKKLYKEVPSSVIQEFVDNLTLYATFSLILGARLVEAIFYSPHLFQSPMAFIAVWEGGLASHGGIFGLFIGCWLFYIRSSQHILFKKYQLHPLRGADIVSLSGVLCGVFIRLGNFMNQEIVGKVSSLPWAILFKHPREVIEVAPRHPSQLYEALGYLLIWVIQTKRLTPEKKPGVIMAETLIGVFLVRWLVEYSKSPVAISDTHGFLTMGQLLSLPFFLSALGFRLYLLSDKH